MPFGRLRPRSASAWFPLFPSEQLGCVSVPRTRLRGRRCLFSVPFGTTRFPRCAPRTARCWVADYAFERCGLVPPAPTLCTSRPRRGVRSEHFVSASSWSLHVALPLGKSFCASLARRGESWMRYNICPGGSRKSGAENAGDFLPRPSDTTLLDVRLFSVSYVPLEKLGSP